MKKKINTYNHILCAHLHAYIKDDNSVTCDYWQACKVTTNVNKRDYACGYNLTTLLGHCLKNGITQMYFQDFDFEVEYIISYLLKEGWDIISNTGFSFKGTRAFKIYRRRNGHIYYVTLFYKLADNSKRRIELRSLRMKTTKDLSTLSDAFCGQHIEVEDDTLQENHPITLEGEQMYTYYLDIMSSVLSHLYRECMRSLTISKDAMINWMKTSEGCLSKLPQLSDDLDSELRKAYRGGFTYLNPKYENIIIAGGYVYDVNSLYPHVMYNYAMPCGIPVHKEYDILEINGIDRVYADPTCMCHDYMGFGLPYNIDTYCIYHVALEGTLKQNGIPCLSTKSDKNLVDGIIENRWLRHLNGGEFWLTNFDLKMVLKNYDINPDSFWILDSYKFNTCTNSFQAYIDYWYNIKCTTTGAIQAIAKMMLNSLYGRFGIKLTAESALPELADDGIVNWKDSDKVDIQQLDKLGISTYNDVRYVPISIFTTSIARMLLIDEISKIGENFIYADTDSIHSLIPIDLPISKKMGEYKLERHFNIGRYLHEKCYINDDIAHVSGANRKITKGMTIENFNPHQKFKGNTRFKRVDGGVLREAVEFTLNKGGIKNGH